MSEASNYFVLSVAIMAALSVLFLVLIIGINNDVDHIYDQIGILFDNDKLFQEAQNELWNYLEFDYPDYLKSKVAESIMDNIRSFLP